MKWEIIPLKFSYWRIITAIERKYGPKMRSPAILAIGLTISAISLTLTYLVSVWFYWVLVGYGIYTMLSEWTDADYEQSKASFLSDNKTKGE